MHFHITEVQKRHSKYLLWAEAMPAQWRESQLALTATAATMALFLGAPPELPQPQP